MSEREAFLEAIKQSPEDEDTRKIFADWLDEHDEPEHAEWMRSFSKSDYRESREWLENYAEQWKKEVEEYHGRYDYEEWGQKVPDTFEKCVALGWEAALGDTEGSIYTPFDTPDFAMATENRKKFWEHWRVVTGHFIPEEGDTPWISFRCRC
jgi:uncharacterized protein (TIGR02996 family)